MIFFRDCLGRLVCKGNPQTGFVECQYKGNKTSTVLSIGESFIIERQEILTVVTRVSEHDFKVISHQAMT